MKLSEEIAVLIRLLQLRDKLISESQERMLVVVVKGQEDIVRSIFEKWDLSCEQIGEVTEGSRVKYYMHDKYT